MVLEHERTFLAKYLPTDLKKSRSKEIIDIHLPTAAHHPDLRIRKNGEKYEITRKFPTEDGGKKVFHEHTTPITKEQFDELSESVKGKRLHKIRYFYEHDGNVYEFSVFRDEFEGLVMIDVEFEDGHGMEELAMPDFCLADVSGHEWKAGGYLAGRRYEDIEHELKKHHYKKL